jgi:hypothetical protein
VLSSVSYYLEASECARECTQLYTAKWFISKGFLKFPDDQQLIEEQNNIHRLENEVLKNGQVSEILKKEIWKVMRVRKITRK